MPAAASPAALGMQCADDLLRPDEDRARRGGRRRRGLQFRHRPGGLEPCRRPEEEPDRRAQRQQDVDLPAGGRPGRVAGSRADEHALRGPQDGSAEDARPRAGDRRSGGAVPAPGQGRRQGRPGGRHALPGTGLPLPRPGRRPQHPPVAEVSGHGQAGPRAGVAARGDGEGPRLRSGGRGPHLVPHAGALSRATTARWWRSRATCAVLHAVARDTLLAADAPRRLAGGRHHGRHVPGQHARADPRASFPTASSTWASASRTPWPWPPAWPRPGCGPSSISTAPSCSGATTRSSRRSRCRTCR